jgi:hypothetical protein
MPMQHAHLIIHKSIDSFINDMNGEEMPSTIDHDRSIRKTRLILYDDWQILYYTVIFFILITSYRLVEGLQRSDKSYIMLRF